LLIPLLIFLYYIVGIRQVLDFGDSASYLADAITSFFIFEEKGLTAAYHYLWSHSKPLLQNSLALPLLILLKGNILLVYKLIQCSLYALFLYTLWKMSELLGTLRNSLILYLFLALLPVSFSLGFHYGGEIGATTFSLLGLVAFIKYQNFSTGKYLYAMAVFLALACYSRPLETLLFAMPLYLIPFLEDSKKQKLLMLISFFLTCFFLYLSYYSIFQKLFIFIASSIFYLSIVVTHFVNKKVSIANCSFAILMGLICTRFILGVELLLDWVLYTGKSVSPLYVLDVGFFAPYKAFFFALGYYYWPILLLLLTYFCISKGVLPIKEISSRTKFLFVYLAFGIVIFLVGMGGTSPHYYILNAFIIYFSFFWILGKYLIQKPILLSLIILPGILLNSIFLVIYSKKEFQKSLSIRPSLLLYNFSFYPNSDDRGLYNPMIKKLNFYRVSEEDQIAIHSSIDNLSASNLLLRSTEQGRKWRFKRWVIGDKSKYILSDYSKLNDISKNEYHPISTIKFTEESTLTLLKRKP
jgi:hypothetical protein